MQGAGEFLFVATPVKCHRVSRRPAFTRQNGVGIFELFFRDVSVLRGCHVRTRKFRLYGSHSCSRVWASCPRLLFAGVLLLRSRSCSRVWASGPCLVFAGVFLVLALLLAGLGLWPVSRVRGCFPRARGSGSRLFFAVFFASLRLLFVSLVRGSTFYFSCNRAIVRTHRGAW